MSHIPVLHSLPGAGPTVALRTALLRRRGLARAALVLVVVASIFTAPLRADEAPAAPAEKSKWEFLVSTGTLVPTGALRDAIKRGDLNTAQLSYVLRPQLALTTTFGWARSRNLASATNSKLDVFTYDVGTEFRAEPRKLSEKVIFQPFAGVGVGGRSYDDHSLGASATHRAALYGSVGGEVGYGRVRLRLEARDNVSGFKSLDGRGTTSTGNDVTVMLGLRIALGKK